MLGHHVADQGGCSPDNFVSFYVFIKIDPSLCPVLSTLLALNAVNAIYYPYIQELPVSQRAFSCMYIHTTGKVRRDGMMQGSRGKWRTGAEGSPSLSLQRIIFP